MSKAVHGLAVGLVGCGLDVTVLCEDGEDSVHRSPAGFEIRCFKREGRSNPTSRLPHSFMQFIESADYPVLAVLNGIFHPSLYRVSRALRKAQVPYIVAPHDPYHPEIFRRRSFIKWIYWYLFEGRMLRCAQRVQVLDLRHAEWLQRLGVYTPVIEVQNGFAEEDVLPAEELSWRTDGDPRLLFLGRMDTHNKGLDVLIDAFGMVTASRPAQLTIQGPDWGDKAALAKKIRHDRLTEHITLLGPDYGARSTTIIGQHDVFCLPSRFEGFGLSALEAMLAGRVLLVSEIAGISPHVRESGCGVVVNPEASSVARGINQLLDMRGEWKQMGLRGRQYAMENLRWDKIAAKVAPDYQQLLPATSEVPPELQTVKNVTLRVGS